MQSSTGQYSTHAGDPAHPVQHSVITASSLGFFLRGVVRPFERGSSLSSSGTIPAAFCAFGPLTMAGDYIPNFGDGKSNATCFFWRRALARGCRDLRFPRLPVKSFGHLRAGRRPPFSGPPESGSPGTDGEGARSGISAAVAWVSTHSPGSA